VSLLSLLRKKRDRGQPPEEAHPERHDAGRASLLCSWKRSTEFRPSRVSALNSQDPLRSSSLPGILRSAIA
jgi:hypothetical protein